MSDKIPRVPGTEDYSEAVAASRRSFATAQSGAELEHTGRYSFDPSMLQGNIENFMGVAQVPIGLAGPLLVNGEHAQGAFFIPLATTEGTLVASYNRGMKIIREAGGVTVTVTGDAMQRAPVFVLENAREARDFGQWIRYHTDDIREVAESTTRTGKLIEIEQYAASKLMFLRFNFTTGDAAGQNMVGKATFFACEWIRNNYPAVKRYALSGNLDTDKKFSRLNTLKTRGKRVTAEVTIPGSVLEKLARTRTDILHRQRQISNLGAFMAGSSNNGSHSANGITALFIATGQDVANVSESSAALVYVEKVEPDDYYFSITLPSLIVATYGGGTGLATQKECLEMIGCYGKGKVNKFAEIVAATVLCGEISLGSAVMAGDWVSSHDRLGRNRP